MRTTNVISSLALAAVFILPATLHAQRNAPSVPFRSGQWGAEFSASNDFQSLGMMRFFSPRRALAFDANLDNTSTSIDGSDAETSNTSYGLSVGYRMYRPLTSGVVGHLTGGLRVNSSSTSITNGAGVTTDNNTRGYGPFGEIGASYFVTPHLSLGAAYGLEYLMTSSKQGATDSSGHSLGSSPLSVRISLYF
jgi:outer membrane protein with beta-barrel domain